MVQDYPRQSPSPILGSAIDSPHFAATLDSQRIVNSELLREAPGQSGIQQMSTPVEEDDNFVDLVGYRIEDGPLLPKSGESFEDVLVSQARDRIVELAKGKEAMVAGFGAERADRRLD